MCTDTIGSFICSCKPEYTGDPFRGCVDIDECAVLDKPCGGHAVCENASPGYNCVCPQGFRANPDPKSGCVQRDVTISCATNFDCTNNAECVDGQCFCQDGFQPDGSVCVDIDECRTGAGVCGPNAQCINTPGSFKCDCFAGYVGTPPRVECKAPCEDITCGPHAYCKPDGVEAYCVCEEGWTFNPRDIAAGCVDIDECDPIHGPSGKCGNNAICKNVPGGYSCQCPPGFTGDSKRLCSDLDECSKPNACGEGAVCNNLAGSFDCACPPGTIADPDPRIRCIAVVTCSANNECPGNAVCDEHQRCLCPEPNVGNDCRHPCETMSCAPNAQCMIVNNVAQCLCAEGFTGASTQFGAACVDIDECVGNPCPGGAVCTNGPGSYSCQCPGGSTGDPYRDGCAKNNIVDITCSDDHPCPSGEACVQDTYLGTNVCICRQGFVRDEASQKCRDVNECSENGQRACGGNALCKNLPGSYECHCPPGFNGNPYLGCEECNSLECQCQPPYQFVGGQCILAGCGDGGKCPKGAECISITGGLSYCACPKGYRTQNDGSCADIDECAEGRQVCGFGADCINTPGGYDCLCPNGYSGDAYHGLCAPAQRRCSADRECGTNEKCVQPGECVCPPPFFLDAADGNKCKSRIKSLIFCEIINCMFLF